MLVDVEETLGRELREVADGLQVPAMPPLPHEPPGARRHWQPLLVAAAVVLIVAVAVAVAASVRGGQDPTPSPAPPSPSPSRTDPVVTIPTSAPTVPYVVDQRLYVDGEQVPGSWWSVDFGDAGWLAQRTDYTWWWGRGAEPTEIAGLNDDVPVISPNGRYVAVLDEEGMLTGFDTSPGGADLGGVTVDAGDRQEGTAVVVRAVTDDGRVIAQGTKAGVLWLPRAGNGTVDLTDTAPGQVILGNTPAGLVVSDGEDGEFYLAELSDAGDLTPIGSLPAHDDVAVSPGVAWLAWSRLGTTRGDVTELSALEAQTVDGSQQVTLAAPTGWGFRVRAWVWEDDDHLISPVVSEGRGERMARCGVDPARCVLISTP